MDVKKPALFILNPPLPKYFNMDAERAVKRYIRSTDQSERSRIFKNELQVPITTTIIDGVFKKYNVTGNRCDINLINDVLTFIILHLDKFDPDRGTLAFNYITAICLNYMFSNNYKDRWK